MWDAFLIINALPPMFLQNAPPYFSMVHLLRRLYGVDAPVPNLGAGHNTKNVRYGKQIARRVTEISCLFKCRGRPRRNSPLI